MSADEAAIRELLLSYPRALDARDWDAYADAFAPDGEFEIMGQRRAGRADIAAGPARDLTRFDRTQHFVTNQQVAVDGDVATARQYVLAIHVPDAAEPDRHADIGGCYDCDCRRTAEGWKLARLRLEIWWTAGVPFGIEPEPAST
jgi:uncharacterized protein (TIGR02246 family)